MCSYSQRCVAGYEKNKQISEFSIINPLDLLILNLFWITTLHFTKFIYKKDIGNCFVELLMVMAHCEEHNDTFQ